MGLDYGFFQALTGPMKAAGDIQANRDAKQLQELQLMQQQRQLELQQLDKQKAIQTQLNTSTQNAMSDLYTKNNFARDKDITEFQQWHKTNSGWAEIQNILRQHGSIDNARLYGGLDYKLQEYYANIKDNPISKRVNKNKASLELFRSYYDDKDGNDKLLTTGAKQRFIDFKEGKVDNFIFHGARKDYLDETIKARNVADAIDLDDVLYTGSNYMDIRSDMINDMNADPNTVFSDDDMKAWLAKELNVDMSGKTTYFGGEAMFGEKAIDTNASTLLQQNIDETNKLGIIKGGDYFNNLNLKDEDTFHKLFNHPDNEMAATWNRFGGYDPEQQTKSYVGTKAWFAKGRQVVSGGRVLIDKGIEDQITQIMFGNHGDSDTPKYVSKNRKIHGVDMVNKYDDRGHQIKQDDIGFDNEFFSIVEEAQTMDLTLNGYFVGLRGTGADGKSILLTDVTNEKDRAKMAEQYKDVIFEPVIIAEMEDFDLLTNDVYYDVLDLGDQNVLMAMNEAINPEKLNEVLTQTATYEEQVARDKMINKRKIVATAKLQRQLNMPEIKDVNDLISGYDQSITVSLGLSQVPAVKIQQVVPLIMSDLYVTSQKERTYPYDLTPGETDPNKKMVAQTPGQYMAYSAKILREGLISGNPSFAKMLEAIKTGNYNEYSRSIYDKKTFKTSRDISKGIIQMQRN
jgi:hypothetical protein